MARNRPEKPHIIEQGDICFLYRPKVDVDEAKGFEDVQRLQLVLHPHGKDAVRLLTIGRKRLPDIGEHERAWGFVEAIADSARQIEERLLGRSYKTKTRGRRAEQPVRPAGEGAYALVRRRNKMYLAYELELPQEPGAVQQQLKIPPRASFALSVKTPDKPAPRGAGLKKEQEAEYPKRLNQEFGGRRFAAEDERLLDYEGAEFVLIGARLDPERELAIEFEEDSDAPDILKELHLARSRHPIEPLLRGGWR